MKLLGREYVLHGNISYSGTPGGWVQGSRVLSDISRHIYVQNFFYLCKFPIIGVICVSISNQDERNIASVFHHQCSSAQFCPLRILGNSKIPGIFEHSLQVHFFKKSLWGWRTFPLILVQTLGCFSKIFNHCKSSRRGRTFSIWPMDTSPLLLT